MYLRCIQSVQSCQLCIYSKFFCCRGLCWNMTYLSLLTVCYNAGHFICSFPVRCCRSCFLRCSRAMRETPSSRQGGWTDSKRWCPSNSVNLKCHGPWYFCCAGAMFWKASMTLFCTLCQCVENKCKKGTFI